jgi:hypothetical protein
LALCPAPNLASQLFESAPKWRAETFSMLLEAAARLYEDENGAAREANTWLAQ